MAEPTRKTSLHFSAIAVSGDGRIVLHSLELLLSPLPLDLSAKQVRSRKFPLCGQSPPKLHGRRERGLGDSPSLIKVDRNRSSSSFSRATRFGVVRPTLLAAGERVVAVWRVREEREEDVASLRLFCGLPRWRTRRTTVAGSRRRSCGREPRAPSRERARSERESEREQNASPKNLSRRRRRRPPPSLRAAAGRRDSSRGPRVSLRPTRVAM